MDPSLHTSPDFISVLTTWYVMAATFFVFTLDFAQQHNCRIAVIIIMFHSSLKLPYPINHICCCFFLLSLLKYATADSTLGEKVDFSQPPEKELVEKEKASLKKLLPLLEKFVHEKVKLQVSIVFP